jgi:hypothetical protein
MPLITSYKLSEEENQAINTVGAREGWCLVTYGTSAGEGYRIERDDEAAVFAADHTAIEFVAGLSANGSKIHKLAMTAHAACEDYRDYLPLAASSIEDIDQLALSEGWLFGTVDDHGVDRFQVSNHDDANKFASDADAYVFVKLRATAGSTLHKMALAAHGQKHSDVMGMRTVQAQVVISVTYLVPRDMNSGDLQSLLDENVSHMIGNGGLTGHTEATAEKYDVTVKMDI